MSSLHIVADENIPCVEEAFGTLGKVTTRPGRTIGNEAARTADVLLLRSVTTVDDALLKGSDLIFVGSATTGTDHVDQAALAAQDVSFAHAPGANAESVADYVVVALLEMAWQQGVSLADRTVGIVGCGNIGGRLAHRLPALGVSVLQNDPPLADAAEARGEAHDFSPLERVLREADILTLHVPLTTDGPYPTYHLIGAAALEHLGTEAWLLNTSRGTVVDGTALQTALDGDQLDAVALDVWPNEPTPSPDLLRATDIATPHIAGYAYDGKVRGTSMLYRALCEHLGVEPSWHSDEALRPERPDGLRCNPPDPRLSKTTWLRRLAQQAYDLQTDDERMRALVEHSPAQRADAFSRLRKTYPRRRELQRHVVPGTAVPSRYEKALAEGLKICPLREQESQDR